MLQEVLLNNIKVTLVMIAVYVVIIAMLFAAIFWGIAVAYWYKRYMLATDETEWRKSRNSYRIACIILTITAVVVMILITGMVLYEKNNSTRYIQHPGKTEKDKR